MCSGYTIQKKFTKHIPSKPQGSIYATPSLLFMEFKYKVQMPGHAWLCAYLGKIDALANKGTSMTQAILTCVQGNMHT